MRRYAGTVTESSRAPRRRRVAAALGGAVLTGALALAPQAALAEGETIADHAVTAAEGESVTIDLLRDSSGIAPGSARLLLDGLPPGSTLTADGRRAVVPEQGTWQVSADGTTVVFTPFASRLGIEPNPIRYSALSKAGDPVGPGLVTVSTPVIPDMVRSAAYGEPVAFPVAETVQNVDAQTLELSGLPGASATTTGDDGTTVTVQGQGTWTLDRAEGTVTFAPESAEVRAVAPILVSGRSAEGEQASQAMLEIGYPRLTDREIAEGPDDQVQFDLMEGARNVRADSLRFDASAAPPGSEVSADGLRLTVPEQGTWTIDPGTATAAFEPVKGLEASPSPVAYSAQGMYADNTTTALLLVQFTPSPPTARADELRGRPGQEVQVDLLANDTPGSASMPLRPASVRISAPVSQDLPQLTADDGTRLVVPGEGTYTVRGDGVLTFAPAADFRGRTSPIEYRVTDAAGIAVTASVTVDIDPQSPVIEMRRDSGGINSMLEGLRAPRTSTFTVFSTFAALLLFSGAVSLWIGARMESDRRSL